MTAGPLPSGFGVVLDARVRVIGGGRSLLGGVPGRLVRLTPAGARALARWRGGEAPAGDGERALARRLVDAGLAHPRPPAGAVDRAAVTIVVPVRDRERQLDRCLAALGAGGASGAGGVHGAAGGEDAGGARLVVVDDGSRDPAAVARVAARHGGEVVRHERSRGAAAARNSGLARAGTPFVAFVDSDCLPTPGWLDALAAHLADPQVAAVAPRIVAAPSTTSTLLGRYEAARSPLDMGPDPGAVAPISRLPYVPSAALLVRRAALSADADRAGGARGDDPGSLRAGSASIATGPARHGAGADGEPKAGFDDAMPIGEDVDLVWRLVRSGWTVRYDPTVAVAHDHRDRLRPWLRRRFDYGTSAAALARRHPGAIPVAVLTPSSAAVWSLVALRRPLPALALLVGSTALLHRRVGGGRGRLAGDASGSGGEGAAPAAALPAAETARLAATGAGHAGWSIAVALTRSWLPLTVPLAIRSRRARPVLLAAALSRAVDVRRDRALRDVPLPAALAITAADDAAYATGLWWGCLRNRTAGPLLPRLLPTTKWSITRSIGWRIDARRSRVDRDGG